MEEWKPVEMNPNYYVSNEGNIFSCLSNKQLKHLAGRDGYERVFMKGPDGIRKSVFIHHLVLRAFGPKQPDGTTCDHIDRDIHNNRIENLRWATKEQQMANTDSIGGKRKKMPVVIKLNGEYLCDAKSLNEAEKITGLPHQRIKDHLESGRPTLKGYTFEVKKNEEGNI